MPSLFLLSPVALRLQSPSLRWKFTVPTTLGSLAYLVIGVFSFGEPFPWFPRCTRSCSFIFRSFITFLITASQASPFNIFLCVWLGFSTFLVWHTMCHHWNKTSELFSCWVWGCSSRRLCFSCPFQLSPRELLLCLWWVSAIAMTFQNNTWSCKQLQVSWLHWDTFRSWSRWSLVVWSLYSVLRFTEALFCFSLLAGYIPLFALTKRLKESHWSMWSFVAWHFCQSWLYRAGFLLCVPGSLKFCPTYRQHSPFLSQPLHLRGFCVLVL